MPRLPRQNRRLYVGYAPNLFDHIACLKQNEEYHFGALEGLTLFHDTQLETHQSISTTNSMT